ncbi:ImmA/IrrE family metallo-endopeptidase [Anaerobacillus sp. HL2]|nr:ImmA/IrrE family metallo-endopeptidase [Anaerobacillus sp. HL2]
MKRFPVSSSCYEIGNYKEIILNSMIDMKEQREDFYHELCHLLRHVGRQMIMPKAFRELQEWDANNFVRYAAIPYHMLFEFDFYDENIATILSERFQVTEKALKQRLEKIFLKTNYHKKLLKRDLYIHSK